MPVTVGLTRLSLTMAPSAALAAASGESGGALPSAEQPEAANVVGPSLILHIVKCVEDLQNHVAFVMARLEQVEKWAPTMRRERPPAAEPQIQAPAAKAGSTLGHDAVSALEASVCLHAQEIEELKMAVRCFGAPRAQAQAQNSPQPWPQNASRLPLQEIAAPAAVAKWGGNDEATGGMSSILSRSAMLPIWSREEFKKDELSEEHVFVQEGTERREFCKASSPAKRFSRKRAGFNLEKENALPLLRTNEWTRQRTAGSCMEKENASQLEESLATPLPEKCKWDRPDESFLKAALDVVDRLPQPLDACSPAVTRQIMGRFSQPSPLPLQPNFNAGI